MAKETKYSLEQITVILVECNNMFLDGQFLYLGSSKAKEKLIRKRWPANDKFGEQIPVTELEKANRLMDYTECEGIARNLKTYMERCQNETK